MITAAAVCPHPPMLLRELTGQYDAAAELRAACRTAVERVLHGADHVVLVGGAPAVPDTACPDLAGGLPWSLRVGVRLLKEARWSGSVELHPIVDTTPTEECLRRGRDLAARSAATALLVLGDGSARRSPKAPGHFDERAHPFDAALVAALRSGDAQGLAGLDANLASSLLAEGRAALQVLAGAAAAQDTPPRAEVHYADDPYGVMYVVAEWLWEH